MAGQAKQIQPNEMKITRPGNVPVPPRAWWIGKTITCPVCNAVIELEDGDDRPRLDYPKRQLDAPPFLTVHPQRIDATCPTRGCHTDLRLSQ